MFWVTRGRTAGTGREAGTRRFCASQGRSLSLGQGGWQRAGAGLRRMLRDERLRPLRFRTRLCCQPRHHQHARSPRNAAAQSGTTSI